MSVTITAGQEVFVAEILENLCPHNRLEFIANTGSFDAARALEQVMSWGEDGGVILTLLDDGMPKAMGGLMPIKDGVGLLWFMGVEGWGHHYLAEANEAAEKVIEQALANGYHRLEGHVLSANSFSGRWYRRLGFDLDGVRRAFGCHGEDVEIYGKVGGYHVRK